MASSAPDKEDLRPPDVFISYSRKDKEFVRRLDDELTARGRQAWVDWEGIRPTEEFMQAIYGAIVVCVKFCRMPTELDPYTIPCNRRFGITVKCHKKRFNAAAARVNVLWQPIDRIRQRIRLIEHVLDVRMMESFLERFCYSVVVNEFLIGKAYEESLTTYFPAPAMPWDRLLQGQ